MELCKKRLGEENDRRCVCAQGKSRGQLCMRRRRTRVLGPLCRCGCWTCQLGEDDHARQCNACNVHHGAVSCACASTSTLKLARGARAGRSPTSSYAGTVFWVFAGGAVADVAGADAKASPLLGRRRRVLTRCLLVGLQQQGVTREVRRRERARPS